MITHEEAYKAHCNAIIGQTADEVDKNHDIVKQYIKQQAKVEKLVDLFKQLSVVNYNMAVTQGGENYYENKRAILIKKIKALEEELK